MNTVFSLDIANQAITNLFVGIAFALLNVIVSYFAPMIPRVISILSRKRFRRALLIGYLIALVIQIATSPYFRSLTTPVAVEFAWSPFQALCNVIGVLVVDAIVMAWNGARRGVEMSGQQLAAARNRAADELSELGEKVSGALAPEDRNTFAARRTAAEQEAAKADAERQQRIDDRLKDY